MVTFPECVGWVDLCLLVTWGWCFTIHQNKPLKRKSTDAVYDVELWGNCALRLTHSIPALACLRQERHQVQGQPTPLSQLHIEFQARYSLWTKHRHWGSFCRDQMSNSAFIAFIVRSVWGARARHSRTTVAPRAKIELWASSRVEGWIHFLRDASVVCYSALVIQQPITNSYDTNTELRCHCTSKDHTHSPPHLAMFLCGSVSQYVRVLGKSSRKENFQKNILPPSNNQLIRKNKNITIWPDFTEICSPT